MGRRQRCAGRDKPDRKNQIPLNPYQLAPHGFAEKEGGGFNGPLSFKERLELFKTSYPSTANSTQQLIASYQTDAMGNSFVVFFVPVGKSVNVENNAYFATTSFRGPCRISRTR